MTTAASPSVSISPGWSLALGILLVIAGVVALLFPVLAAVTAALYVGWFALIAGVIALVVTWRTRNEPHLGWRIAVGILYIVLGFLLVANPVAGAASLALLVGGLMAASGVVEIMLAVRHKPKAGWGWLLADGIISILLAVLIVIGWPLSSLVLIGYLVGFQIILCGVARIALGMGARKLATPAAT
ncbi:MAG TPA: HdeD family acid-resistance protein [Casimicrobiaceae bacterium]|nr:HdeD family acid-resistance protein [Casimicrobiaceae bacterium]